MSLGGAARRTAVLTTLGIVSAATTLTIVSAETDPGQASSTPPVRRPAVAGLPDLPAIVAPVDAYSASARVTTRGAVGSSLADSELASAAIPSRALAAYRRAEAILGAVDPACSLPWEALAAIGSVESNHGRYAGSLLDDDGVATPAILGPPLDGRGPVALIRDTDAGRYDRDRRFDRAVGPMQFLPTTWNAVGVDADGDGRRDPQDIEDSALAAGVFLCGGSEDLGTAIGLSRALFRYNRSWDYVRLVTGLAERYAAGLFTDAPDNLVPGITLAPAPAASAGSSPQPASADVATASGGDATSPAPGDTGAADPAGPDPDGPDPDDGPGSGAPSAPPAPEEPSPTRPPSLPLPEPVEDLAEAVTGCLEDVAAGVVDLDLDGITSCVGP